jgi:hypothetical protein
MNRFMIVFAALALASGSVARAEGDGSSLGSMGERTKSKPKPPPDPKAKKKPVDPKKAELHQVKRAFEVVVGLCEKPGACEYTSKSRDEDLISLLQEKERAFVLACEACADKKACDDERQRIREGKPTPGYAPCK